MKKLSKQLALRIEELNALIVARQDDFITTYAGTTHPYIVNVAPLEISPSGQFVKVKPSGIVGSPYAYQQSIERYNMNDKESLGDFRYTLNTLLRAYRAA